MDVKELKKYEVISDGTPVKVVYEYKSGGDEWGPESTYEATYYGLLIENRKHSAVFRSHDPETINGPTSLKHERPLEVLLEKIVSVQKLEEVSE